MHTDPSDGGATLYAQSKTCIAVSTDGGDTFGPCWANLTGSLSIKDSQTMLLVRDRPLLPLRTTDGGKTWAPLTSLAAIAADRSIKFLWSWTGKTLALYGAGGTQSDDHPHPSYVWVSTDDGDTWTDVTGPDLITMSAGISQWYHEDNGDGWVFMSSSGQGLFKKLLERGAVSAA